ncbi:hypothetical protein [Psychroserpens sp. SPM9]|uniref:hypothetical protein n=1 Tax=Psychroserpens sp. SPM9 TaxID=2975598 RepID=UPI0021A875F1|nr:hypothetical protein [Psychroserpens sp. SPM9]MDG5491091.1 hypothetical protein [Psychroserpens sp. SPM9]
MSEKLPDSQNSEEIDLGQLFNAIGNLFEKFFRFLKSVFKTMLSLIVFLLKAVIDNFKLIAAILLVSAVLGYSAEKFLPKTYESSMLVKPYFDSQYQLITNINYYNALIDNKDYNTLSKIFEIHKDTVQKIKSLEINLAPEAETTKLLKYERFIKSIDSTRALDISFDDFIENEDIYTGDKYEIVVESFKKDIFQNLGTGIAKSFTNTYSLNKKKKKDSLNFLQKQNLLEAINEVDSLQKVYIEVLEEESKASKSTLKFGGDELSLDKEKSNTKEFELLNKEIQLRDQLRRLEEQKVEEDVFFDIISGFQEVGDPSKEITERYTFIFPILAFVLICFLFFISRIVRFVKNYEA